MEIDEQQKFAETFLRKENVKVFHVDEKFCPNGGQAASIFLTVLDSYQFIRVFLDDEENISVVPVVQKNDDFSHGKRNTL